MPTKKDGGKSTSLGVVKLTPKQERFCQRYIELGNASEAYRQSYDCSKMQTKTIHTKAKELLKNGPITVRIEALKQAQQERHQIIADLQEVRDMCMGRKSVTITETIKNAQEGTVNTVDNPVFMFEPASANKALELLGKHLGMFTQKVDMISSDGSMALGSLRDLFANDTEANT